ncbi:hypothetical protein K4G88_25160, partial [Mycobacterium tuberculosis]|nr:hypothetical protein [Mycobacterium tuberculosis]
GGSPSRWPRVSGPCAAAWGAPGAPGRQGVVLAGAVQDFMVLFVSTRRDGRSLGELVKEEMGPTAGVLALVACFMIM